MLKYSFYNVLIDKIDNGFLIFNSVSRSFAVIDFAFINYLQSNKIIDESNIDNYFIDKIKIAKENGFLVPEDIDEQRLQQIQERISQYTESHLSLTIATTMQCNFACPYCYQTRDNITLDNTAEEAIISFVERNISGVTRLTVTWYGGEPLLNFKSIQKLSKAFIDLCKEKEIDYSASIITNGYLLTEDIAKELQTYQVKSAQITLDGYKEVHNKRRNLKTGGDSFSVIAENIDKARKYFAISIRVNIDSENANDVDKMLDFCQNRDWNVKTGVGIYFSRVHEQNANEYDSYIDENVYSKFDEDLTRKLIGYFGEEYLARTYPRRRTLPCGSVRIKSFVIAPDGKLYKCWEEINKEEFCVGDVKSGVKMCQKLINWIDYQIPRDCLECDVFPVCPRDCIRQRKDKEYSNCKYTNQLKRKEIIRTLQMFYQYRSLKR